MALKWRFANRSRYCYVRQNNNDAELTQLMQIFLSFIVCCLLFVVMIKRSEMRAGSANAATILSLADK